MLLIPLLVMSFLFSVAFLPSSVAKKKAFGTKWLLSNRRSTGQSLPDWGERVERAYANLKDNFPTYAVAVFAAYLMRLDSTLPLALAWIYVACRVIHFGSYAYGVVWLRALSWVAGLLCTWGLLILAAEEILLRL